MAAEHQRLHISRRQFAQRVGVAGLGLLAGCGRFVGTAPRRQTTPRAHRRLKRRRG
jgi:hypothetical protein